MEIKADGPGTAPEFESHEGGCTWIAHPQEGMQRASHALATEHGVWLVDPIDTASLDSRLADVGEVTGIVVLLNRHERDSVKLANRHDVSIRRPPGVTRDFDAPTEDVEERLPGTDYQFVSVKDWPFWREVGLWDGDTLVVPESFGTNPFSRCGDEELGINTFMRLTPPKGLSKFDPERILVGHGAPLLENPTMAMTDALKNARLRLPRAVFESVQAMVGTSA